MWTTGSWLLYEYLEQASPADRKRMEEAIGNGDICWHALPFNWQTELMDASQIAGSLALSRALDERFGKNTTGAKMTDVPGHTRGLIAPLAAGGVTFLNIGVNGGSRPAEVPPLFRWKDAAGHELTVMYHHEYGAGMPVPESDLAIAVMARGDNSGPHTEPEIAAIYADLSRQFPNAQVMPGGLAQIADAIQPLRDKLPVVTQEMGDTWIYGCASDPTKQPATGKLDKCGEQIPALDVVPSGGRHMHGNSTGFECSEGDDILRVDTLDAPVVAVGERSPLNCRDRNLT